MKVLMINGSPHAKGGCIYRALEEMGKVFNEEGVGFEIITVGNKDIRGCVDCRSCRKTGKCVFFDLVNEISPKFEEADGLIIGSPVSYGSANGTLISFLDRLFFSSSFDKSMKVGASIVSCRRGGNTATFDELNKYFTINQMPVASSCYWNMVHGHSEADVEKDLEGLYTMRVLARNMVFLMKAISDAKNKYVIKKEDRKVTNFADGK